MYNFQADLFHSQISFKVYYMSVKFEYYHHM